MPKITDAEIESIIADLMRGRESGGERCNCTSCRAAEALRQLMLDRRQYETALEPFAAIPTCKIGIGVEAAHYWSVTGSPDKTHFTREDLHRAKAAMDAMRINAMDVANPSGAY